MVIETRTSEGVTILLIRGKLTVEQGSQALHNTVRNLVHSGRQQIILNLGGINYIDSTGIESLVSSYTTVRRSGGDLKFSNLTRRVHHLLDITRLLTIFDVYTDEKRAVASFSLSRAGVRQFPES